MANTTSTLSAQKREKSGKGPARQLRMKGLVPAVCYGPHDKPLHFAVDPEAIKKAIATPHKFNTVINLDVEGTSRVVLFKDYEADPLDGRILHADFLEVRMDQEVLVNVPVVLTGKAVGVTEGGILQQVARTLPVLSKPAAIPEKIEVDVSALKVNDSIHVSEIKAPEGVKFKARQDATIAVVAVPEKEEEVKPAVAAAVPGAEGAAAPAAGAAGAAAPAAGGAAPAAGAGAAAPAKGGGADKGGKK